MIHPRCEKCGNTMTMDVPFPDGNIRWSCFQCDKPVYQNHCFYIDEKTGKKCRGHIDSRKNQQSQTPGMGFHCLLCGEDLTKWKRYEEERLRDSFVL